VPHKTLRIQAAIQEANSFFNSPEGVEAVQASTTPAELADAIGGTDFAELRDAVEMLDSDKFTVIFHHIKAAVEIGAERRFLWNDRPGQNQLIATSYTTESPMDIVVHAEGTPPDSTT
jgi:hypothetical protein